MAARYRGGMHVRRGALGWGVFLILAGSIPLLVRAGVLSDSQVRGLWTLWPMILIGLGVGLLLARTRFSFVGGVIVAATFGLIVGGLLSSGFNGVTAGACGSSEGASAFPSQVGILDAGRASVDIDLDCGDVAVGTAGGVGWTVMGESRGGRSPEVESDADRLAIHTIDGGGLFGIFSTRSSWQVTIPNVPVTDLELDANAGRATLALDGANLGVIDIGLNAGSTTVDLAGVAALRELRMELNAGSAGITFPNLTMTGTIEANAGAVRLCVPANVGLRIETGGSFAASYDFHDLVEDESVWTSPGYDSAPVRIDLRTDGTAASFTLDPEGGCDG
jgi:LiaF transmembrane domain